MSDLKPKKPPQCDRESARLGFEVLASALNDVRYNSTKTIANLRERIAVLEAERDWLQDALQCVARAAGVDVPKRTT